MIEVKEIEKLAKLSRLELSPDEKIKFQKDINSILNYIDQIKKVSVSDSEPKTPLIKNVLREDAEPNVTGSMTDSIVKEFPEKEGNYLKVKKILS